MTPKCRTIEINSKEVNPYVFSFCSKKSPRFVVLCILLCVCELEILLRRDLECGRVISFTTKCIDHMII